MIDWLLLMIILAVFTPIFVYGIIKLSKSPDTSKLRDDIETLGKAFLQLHEKVKKIENEIQHILKEKQKDDRRKGA